MIDVIIAVREKALEGQVTAANKGNHGGRPKVVDDDMLLFARALKDKGVPVPEIAKKLTIKTGRTPDSILPPPPSTARSPTPRRPTCQQAHAQVIAPRRPTRVDLTGPGSGADPALMGRLERQVLGPRDRHPSAERPTEIAP